VRTAEHALFLAIRAERIQAAARKFANFDLKGWEARMQDLRDAFGTPRIELEVLRGKANLNEDLSERLSQRFHVRPDVFF
jgi:antitoxin component HigA of HigAB toxin-antitoxin module